MAWLSTGEGSSSPWGLLWLQGGLEPKLRFEASSLSGGRWEATAGTSVPFNLFFESVPVCQLPAGSARNPAFEQETEPEQPPPFPEAENNCS